MTFFRYAGLAAFAAACILGTASSVKSAPAEDVVGARHAASDTPADYSSWAVDPTVPGPSLPPVGRSLFDFLFTDVKGDADHASAYQLPFPFSALIERVASRLGNREFMGGIRVAIVPMGRSLQRVAAAPDFFMYPRTIITVTGEPRTSPGDAGMLLKDRLYIAYVEKTATLEVISYNEAAGRFEFQLVKDYRDGAQPQVFYADRPVCIACHQNHAPIFSLPTWRETNANGQVADLLRADGTDMHLSAQANIDFPDDFEKATIRANELITLQTVWRHGCTDEHDALRSRRCRAAAFAAILQYGLSGKHDFDANASRYRDDFVTIFNQAWSRRWPHGLHVAQSSIPDRNPFGGATSAYASGVSEQSDFDWVAAANVAPDLDPLTPRPAREIWRFAGAMDTTRLISGWANFFAADDFRTLDRILLQREAQDGVQRTVYRAQCSVARGASSAELNLQCAANPRSDKAVNLVAHVDQRGKARIDWMNFGPAGTLRDVDLRGRPTQSTEAGYVLQLAPKKAALATRLPDGRRLAQVQIRWSADNEESAAAQAAPRIEAIVVDDFAPVYRAIDRLLEQDPELFDAVALMRARLMPALLAELGPANKPAPEKSSPGKGSPEKTWCCVNASAMPPPALDAPEVDVAAVSDERLQPFFRYCATCHFTGERFPPNFLSGKANQVAKNLRHCAPRLLVRLAAWKTPANQRVKTPMPPATALPELGMSAQQWADSEALAQLRAYVQQLAQVPGQPESAPENYEALPACLPPAQ